ncbi:MAG TPA: ATP-dependent 6-phosphofructokinase, partial [Actinomycetota bacterium]|nr:ATP-dependent 6-phosphofructokinase [Actinomycetota bacterium]
MRLGILTGGGDCPGLNAVIRAVVRRGIRAHGMEFVGFHDGWHGVLDDVSQPLGIADTTGILPRGGTILGSSGADPYRVEGGPAMILATIAKHELDGLVVIGGEGTLGVAVRLADEGVRIVGVPKTIDNDLAGTDVTVGFHTAVQVATDAIDRLHSTAESHDRVMLVEVMGRHSGWIAVYAGMAGGADAILIPEHPFDVDGVCHHLRHRHASRSSFSIVVVAEGALPVEGTLEIPEPPLDENGFPRLGGLANHLAPEIEKRTGFQTRVTILGHVQRGGSPVSFDRVLATRFGIAA